jgi:hypothetical protein
MFRALPRQARPRPSRSSLASALALAVLLAPAPVALADPSDQAASSYRIETAGTTEKVEVGKPGTLVLSIVPIASVHVDPRAPLKILLEATPGLSLSKTSLGKADPVDPKADGRRFEVPFVASAAGKHEARATLDFFVCSDKWCVKQTRDVTVAIEAR